MRVGAACKAQAPRAPSRVALRCTASLPDNLWTAARPPLRHSCCRRDAAASARRFKAGSVQALSRPLAGYEREAAFCPWAHSVVLSSLFTAWDVAGRLGRIGIDAGQLLRPAG